MVKNEIIENVIKFTNIARNHFDIEMAILYGSYVRGEERKWSDIDVALIVRKRNDIDHLEQMKLLYILREEADSRIEPALFYLEEYNDREEASFLSEIIRTGEIVYQKNRAA